MWLCVHTILMTFYHMHHYRRAATGDIHVVKSFILNIAYLANYTCSCIASVVVVT
jgi:hypothetical protein